MFLKLCGLSKIFSNGKGIKNINLGINEGEFVTLLGPSGCGKTTILNLIGGFLKLDSGKILLEKKDISNMEPEFRPVSTVFQSYALFPHMTVEENISFGLRYYKKLPIKKLKSKSQEYINLVGLKGYEQSKISNLSGGQQQRVALARSVATEPKILLLDEPLSNLDANLRYDLQNELINLKKKLNITMIFVTHDQNEALKLSDKIVLMRDGTIEQIGSPEEIYYKPKNEYVGKFIGEANILKKNGRKYIVRPEEIDIRICNESDNIIKEKSFMGEKIQYTIKTNQGYILVNKMGLNKSLFEIGDRVLLEVQNKILI